MLQTLTKGTAGAILIMAFVIASGLYLSRFKVKGISIGTTWILFVGIILSHFGLRIDPIMLSFIKDFGLILFVFAIGLQVGPGFFRSFQKGGLPMNLMAVLLVLLAVATTLVIHAVTGEDLSTLTGVMSAAVTNTPGLGAAQETLSGAVLAKGGSLDAASAAASRLASAYAVAYPLGVLGAIFLVIILQKSFRIDINKETLKADESSDEDQNVCRIACKVENPAIYGRKLAEVAAEGLGEHFVISRVMRESEVTIPDPQWVFKEGDEVLIVSDAAHRDKAKMVFGEECPIDLKKWRKPGSNLVVRWLSVTKSGITGKTLKGLDIRHKYNVNVTRALRAGIEIQADPDLILQVGDSIKVVGTEEGINKLASLVGNQPKNLSKPNLVPIFFGIALGVLVGMIPIRFPHIPQPLKLGLAGGSLIVAILLGHFGPKMRITTYTELGANLMLREIGISMFMAAVGLGAGENFVSSLTGGGWIWILYGAIITIVPMLIVALVAKLLLKMDFFRICGLLSGGTTDPALLAFSEQMYGAGRIAVNYATVYPLTMFLRVVAAQILIMIYI